MQDKIFSKNNQTHTLEERSKNQVHTSIICMPVISAWMSSWLKFTTVEVLKSDFTVKPALAERVKHDFQMLNN